MRSPILPLLAIIVIGTGLPRPAVAQSSMFGARGVGLPGRWLSPRALATGGSFGLFDAESGLNPAALTVVKTRTASFALSPEWRHWETPAGTASPRDTRFPLLQVTGPIPGSRLVLSAGLFSYADRDFRLASVDTLILRGVPVGVSDTLSSLGGLNDIRLAAGYTLTNKTAIGGALHIITGSSRLEVVRRFSDSTYATVRQRSELGYGGVGLSLGVIRRLSRTMLFGATVRSDLHATVDQDSASSSHIDLPYSFAAGIMFQPQGRLAVALQGGYHTWSAANSDLIGQGGVGSINTYDLAAGLEYTTDPRRPSKRPLRLGVRYSLLPFPLVAGDKPHEFSISGGTGLSFAKERAGLDLTIEHAWRSEGSAYRERALIATVGITVRP